MKTKQIVTSVALAFIGGLIALILYAAFFDNSKRAILGRVETPYGFTNLPANFDSNNFNFVYAAEKTVHAVVHVKTQSVKEYNNPIYEFFYGERYSQPVVGFGSGVIITDDGYIVTNNHVVESAEEVYVTLNDKREFTAELIGSDPSTDLALLKIKTENLPYIPFGSSDELRVGEWVLAVGNPFNITSTVTAGIVSAKGKSMDIIQDKYRVESFIQTDAALNRGNSGGALVNTNGELVGINAAIVSPSGGYAGISFAIPVSIVQKVVLDLKEFGVVQRGILGISISEVTDEIAKKEKLAKIEGVYVSELRSDGAAVEAGIERGDVITAINDVYVNSPSELQEQVSRYRPGDKVKVSLKRNNKVKQFEVTLRNLQGTTNLVKTGTFDTILGAVFEELNSAEKQKLGISTGVRVAELKAGKLLKEGVREGFIITQINNKPVNSVDDIKRIIDSISGGVYIEGIYPNGVTAYYAFGM
jgi:Do/DeqQ family serine protease